MLDRIIISKLADGGRLVIPRLGTFFVREDGHIVFSELLRSDDGVLRGLLVSRGVGESEAAGVVDRFVFEIRHAIDHNRPYRVGTLGILYRDERGIIRFSPDTPSGAVRNPSQEVRDSAADNAVRQPSPEGDSAAAAEPERKPASAGAESVNRAVRRLRRLRRRGGADFVLIIAAITLLAAVGVIIYGYFTANEVRETSFVELFVGHRTAGSDGEAQGMYDESAPAESEMPAVQ